MTYEEVVSFLYDQLPVFHRVGKKAFKPGLGNIEALAGRLGNPQNSFKTLHIAGTNGKGSSSHFIASILQEQGFTVGLYTSPHLKSFTERIKINRSEVSQAWIVDFFEKHRDLIADIQPSFFEWTVIMAFQYFHEQQVDWAIIETGLGGRLDSTNIIFPEACLITNIGWDHQDILGDSLVEIAQEKAGIIKNNTPILISERQPEIASILQAKATESRAPIQFADELVQVTELDSSENTLQLAVNSSSFGTFVVESPYVGTYQIQNIRGVIAWCEQLQAHGKIHISKNAIIQGIEHCRINTQLMGRWDVRNNHPMVVSDTGHNESGIRLLVEQVKKLNKGHLFIILGMVADKDLERVLALFPIEATYIFAESTNPRSLKATSLQALAISFGLAGICIPDVNEALAFAKEKAASSDFILICGSTYLVAELAD